MKLLSEGKAVNVLAMPPYDQLIGPALKQQYPNAQVAVKPWPIEGKSLADLENYAKAVRTMKPNLLILAVPGRLAEKTPQDFHKHYAWIMNWSLSFGPQAWDVVVALPSTAKPVLNAFEQANETFARCLIKAQDLSLIERLPGDETSLAALLTKWLSTQK